MRRLYGPALLLLVLAPGLGRAQEAPEQLLPAGAQVYLRWDGLEAHKAAYAKTALGKMMAGDTGVFLKDVFGKIQDGIGTVLSVEGLLGGAPPEELKKMKDQAEDAAKLPALVGKTGFVLAVEVRKLEPPDVQATLILPDADKPAPLFNTIRLIAGLSKAKVNDKKIEGRDVSSLEGPGVHLAWWSEGKHAVVLFGTEAPEAAVKRVKAGDHARLPSAPLFKRVKGFDKFETGARAFVDLEALAKVAEGRGKEFAKLFDELGLRSLKSLVLYSGFEGEAERGLVELETAGPREGLLKLLGGKPFKLADVPPLPPDVTAWSMNSFDSAVAYDVAVTAAESFVRAFDPDRSAEFKDALKSIDLALGMDLRKDLLSGFGDQVVQYSSPSEGPLSLGAVLLIKVKDPDKVKDGVEQLIKGLSRIAGAEVRLRKRTYRGAEVREVHYKAPGFIFVPSYTIHKGWLAVSVYPQPVHGYILRANGDVPAWKPSAKVKGLLDQMPGEFVSIAYSDPRPSIKQLLSVGPLIAASINAFSPEAGVEVGVLPNAQEATQPLFPNVAVSSDDGKVLRLESRSSLALPLDVTGLDTYTTLFLFASLARFG
jgi:hypothetical protein